MPEMNGFDTCQLIKQTFPDLKVPVLFFSGSTHENSKKQAREAGGDDFIAKPFSPDKLIERIDQWVSKSTGFDIGEVTHDPSHQNDLVLIADDSRTVRKMITMVLGKAGFTVDGHESGHGLIMALNDKKPALIILDVEMPDLDGFGTCERIRQGFPDLTTPILFFTSHNTEENLTLTELVGGNGFLSKSNSPAKLVEVVKKWPNVRIEKKQPL